MQSTKMKKYFSLALAVGGFLACTPDFQGEYSNPEEIEIVDDRWNETDARKTGEILINSMLAKPWLLEHVKDAGKKPIVMVNEIENRTDEHIDTEALGEAISHELLNSGKIRFVDAKRRKKILTEMNYQNQSGMVRSDHIKKLGRQIGADFLLSGAISSSVHSQGGLKTVTYQTVLELTKLETAEIVWKEKYDIKKRFKRSGSGW